MDRLDAMSVLLSVVEAGSFSAAARRLGAPLATVSRKVAQLENHLGAKLLVRSNRQLALTDAGRSYVAACRRILGDLGEAERAAAGEYSAPRGDLTITAPIVFGRLHVLPIVTAFLQAYPDINIRMVLADRVIHLLDNQIDLAVRIGELPDSSLVAVKVGTVQRVVCASPAYFAAHGRPRRPHDLQQHRCIAFEGLMPPEGWTFKEGNTDRFVQIRPRLIVNSSEAANDAAIAGLGITSALSYQVDHARRAGLLKLVLARFAQPPIPVSLVHAGQGLLPLKLRTFLDFAAPRLKSALAQIMK